MCEREKVRVCAVESERERRRNFSIITVSSISWGPTFIGLSLWPDLICRCSLGRRMDRVWGLLRSHLKAEVFIETFGQAIAVCLVGPVSQRDTHTAFSRNSRRRNEKDLISLFVKMVLRAPLHSLSIFLTTTKKERKKLKRKNEIRKNKIKGCLKKK